MADTLPPLPELPEPAHHVRVGDGKYRNAWSAAQIQILLRDYGAKCHAAGVAAERERWALKCDQVAAILRRDPTEKKQISARMAEWLAKELRDNAEVTG